MTEYRIKSESKCMLTIMNKEELKKALSGETKENNFIIIRSLCTAWALSAIAKPKYSVTVFLEL